MAAPLSAAAPNAALWRRLIVLVDLSGTLHIEDKATPGAIDALKKLRNLPNVLLKFVTNTTKESERSLHERLIRCGFEIERHEIFSSLSAAKRMIQSFNLRPLLLLEESAKEDFKEVDQENPNAVVVGLAPSEFHYESLNVAFNLLLDNAQLIAIHKGRYFKRSEGLALGPGPFVAALEYATEKKALVVGKPCSKFFLDALESLQALTEADETLEAASCIMIGDDVLDDICGAQEAGMRGILVRTGKYRVGDESLGNQQTLGASEEGANSDKEENDANNKCLRPWRVADNFAHAVLMIENLIPPPSQTKKK